MVINVTDEQIIKALPTVAYGGHSCNTCKWKFDKGEVRCGLKGCRITRNALDLIKRQKAEIERLQLKVEVIQEAKEQLEKDVFNAEMNLDGKDVEIMNLKHEIERLQEENKNHKSVIEAIEDTINPLPFETDFDKAIKTAKTEAIKECIEKVKEEIAEALESNYKARAERIDKHNVGDKTDFISYCGGKIDCLRGLEDFLDNLVKEMVGDDNA